MIFLNYYLNGMFGAFLKYGITEKDYSRQVFVLLILFAIFGWGCDGKNNSFDENNPPIGTYLNEFVSLTADKDSIRVGESTQVTAVVDGRGLIMYEWQATRGDILGAGFKITYLPRSCSVGVNTITCKAKLGSVEFTRSIQIMVYDPTYDE